jgi:hypothetical protein
MMNDHIRTIMLQSWENWHRRRSRPLVNMSYEKGFAAALDALIPLLRQCHPHVHGSHGAEHMLDGFKPQPRPIDALLKELEEVLHEPK